MEYIKVKKKISVGANPGDKFLARLWRNADVTIEDVATEISQMTSLSYPDVLACLKSFEIVVPRYIMNGTAVKFPCFGHFIPSISSKAQTTIKKVTADSIKGVSCRFYPSANFKKALKGTTFTEKNLAVKGYDYSDVTGA